MKFSSQLELNRYILEPQGDLLGHVIPDFETALRQAIQARPTHLLLDCQSVRYLSTEAINLLLCYRKELLSRNIALQLRHLNPTLLKLLNLLKLNSVFDIVA